MIKPRLASSPLACFELNILQNICLEHARQQIGRAKLQANEEKANHKQNGQRGLLGVVEAKNPRGNAAPFASTE